MNPLTEYIKESILSSTGAGTRSIILSSVIKYLKDIKKWWWSIFWWKKFRSS